VKKEMRYEHYKRVVQWDRKDMYPERKHEVDRPRLDQVTRVWGRKGRGFDPSYVRSAWSALHMITGQEPRRLYTKKSVAHRRLKEGDPVGCQVIVSGKPGYERREQRIARVRPEIRPFTGFGRKGNGMDDKGQRTFHLEQPGVRPARTPYYEEYYPFIRGKGAGTARYLSLHTTARTKEIGEALLRGRRVPRNRGIKEKKG
jgi:ribosomal protein L5